MDAGGVREGWLAGSFGSERLDGSFVLCELLGSFGIFLFLGEWVGGSWGGEEPGLAVGVSGDGMFQR